MAQRRSGNPESTLTDPTSQVAPGRAQPSVAPGRYQHFKGAIYVVIGTASHSESDEPFVVYHREGDERLWARPAAMWAEAVDRDGYSGPRFRALD